MKKEEGIYESLLQIVKIFCIYYPLGLIHRWLLSETKQLENPQICVVAEAFAEATHER